MSERLSHEIKIDGPYQDKSDRVSLDTAQMQLPFRAWCSCGWEGPPRLAQLTARIDAKTHRIDTAFEDDSNTRKPARNTPK